MRALPALQLTAVVALSGCRAARCADGEHLEEDTCTPDPCGEGPWGALDQGSGALHVNAAVEAGGSGTATSPLSSLGEALGQARSQGIARVLIGAGRYEGPLIWGGGELTLEGRCADLVILDGGGDPLLQLEAGVGPVTIAGLSVEDFGPGAAGGALATSDADLTLREVSLRDGAGPALRVSGEATLTLSSVSVEDVEGDGVSLDEAGIVAEGLTIRSLRSPDESTEAVGLRGQTCTGSASEVEISEVEGVGVLLTDCVLSLEHLSVSDVQPVRGTRFGQGISVTGGVVEIDDLSVTRATDQGIGLQDGGRMSISRAQISETSKIPGESDSAAIHVTRAAYLEGRELTLTDNIGFGLLVARTAQVSLEDVDLRSSRRSADAVVGAGIAIGAGSVRATRLVIAENEGPGVLALAGAELHCEDCTIRDNSFAGILGLGEVSITLNGGTRVSGTLPDAAIGGGIGVAVLGSDLSGAASLSLSDTQLADHELCSVYLSGAGAYEVTGSDIGAGVGEGYLSWPAGCGVFVSIGVEPWGGSSGLLLDQNHLWGARSAAIVLDRASAQLSANTFSDNTLDLLQQGCELTSTPPPGAEEVASQELCPTYDHMVDPPDWYHYSTELDI